MRVKIALAQTVLSHAPSAKEDHLKKGLKLMKEAAAKGVKAVVFPENFMGIGETTPEDIDGPFVSTIAKRAGELGIYVVVGIREKSPIQDKHYNTVVLIDSKGAVIRTHRKLHLFDAFNFKESDTAVAGNDITLPIMTELGMVGLITCYEIRFPEITRILTLMGTEILFVPSAWTRGLMKEEHWMTMLKARALENTIFVVAPGQTGNVFIGRSLVVDPFGIVIADAGEEEKLLIVELNLDRIANVRKTLPVLKHRRNDIYQRYWR